MTLPDHFFIASNGDLHDTRDSEWSSRPLRKGYARHYRGIDNVQRLKASIRADQYAWPGGYALAFLTSDGGTLCFDCVKREFRNVADSVRSSTHDGWNVTGLMSTAETDEETQCDHCGKSIT